MEDVTFANRRGLALAGHYWPADGTAAVALIHGFCNDKASDGRFGRLGAALQRAGMAALAFDVAGCGESQDAVLSATGMIDDLAAACAWLRAAGKERIGLFGNSLGGSICLKAALPGIRAIAASGAGSAAMPYDWSAHFEPHQLEELEHTGHITQAVESAWREEVVIGAQMLLDFTDPECAANLEAIACPVLLLYGGDEADREEQALLAAARCNLPRLPAGSRIAVIAGARHGLRSHWDESMDRIVPWLRDRLQP